MLELYESQREAILKLHNGCILCGSTGSGKSRTGLGYYYLNQGGDLADNCSKQMANPKDLYIITTPKKRDKLEWEEEMLPLRLNKDPRLSLYHNKVVVDSWNNIQKYKEVTSAFFIFDEDRVVGYGAWTKAFLDITKANDWILLTATPGDCWMDYMPVFVANGFYKNKTEFINNHCIYDRFVKYPKIKMYIGTGKLERLRDSILVDMSVKRDTVQNHIDVKCNYNFELYKSLGSSRRSLETGKPFKSAGELCYAWRKIVNSDPSRIVKVQELCAVHDRVIIFYNFDYELEILKSIDYQRPVGSWNGHVHESIPQGDRWIYLVQYTAGSEAWNCISTDTMIFYSQNYSWKIMTQASGRIDRLNTSYKNLYYYHLKSSAPIDLAISRALKNKHLFNEKRFIKPLGEDPWKLDKPEKYISTNTVANASISKTKKPTIPATNVSPFPWLNIPTNRYDLSQQMTIDVENISYSENK